MEDTRQHWRTFATTQTAARKATKTRIMRKLDGGWINHAENSVWCGIKRPPDHKPFILTQTVNLAPLARVTVTHTVSQSPLSPATDVAAVPPKTVVSGPGG